MIGQRRYLLVAIVLVAGVLALAGPALANHTGVSQFLAFKSGSRNVHFWNPSAPEMFVLIIDYDKDENFQSCHGRILSRHDVSGAGGNKGYTEIISVPTSNPRRDPSHLIGLDGMVRYNNDDRRDRVVMTKVDDRVFRLPQSDKEGLQDLLDCACQELDEKSLPHTLLSPFGFHLPPHCPTK